MPGDRAALGRDPAYVHEAAKRGVFAYIVDTNPEELQSAIDITLQRFTEYHSLQGAFGRRAVIEQAKGILMARHAIDADKAFEMLRNHSQHNGHKLSTWLRRSSTATSCSCRRLPAPPTPSEQPTNARGTRTASPQPGSLRQSERFAFPAEYYGVLLMSRDCSLARAARAERLEVGGQADESAQRDPVLVEHDKPARAERRHRRRRFACRLLRPDRRDLLADELRRSAPPRRPPRARPRARARRRTAGRRREAPCAPTRSRTTGARRRPSRRPAALRPGNHDLADEPLLRDRHHDAAVLAAFHAGIVDTGAPARDLTIVDAQRCRERLPIRRLWSKRGSRRALARRTRSRGANGRAAAG